MISTKVILDSISPEGQRLTTMETTFHRFVLAEYNTHRVFSRNSASSRAIPVEKQLQRLIDDPATPLEWPCEQAGMSGGAELIGQDLEDALSLWTEAFDSIYALVNNYIIDHPDKSTRLHKSVINRLLEPFMWHTVITTSTNWDNFFGLRCHPDAQPEIRIPAEMMLDAYNESTPTLVNYGKWHTPYIIDGEEMPSKAKLEVSAARCARVSSLTHDGVRDFYKDLDLYYKLTSADPRHDSPLEHPATPAFPDDVVRGNFTGWHQLRHWNRV